MNNEQTTCLICGENLEEKYSLQLNCKHSYHYECLQTSLDYMNKNKTGDNRCLYCNQSFGLIPVVNGLKKLKYGIHWIDTPPEYENKKCDFILSFLSNNLIKDGSNFKASSTILFFNNSPSIKYFGSVIKSSFNSSNRFFMILIYF